MGEGPESREEWQLRNERMRSELQQQSNNHHAWDRLRPVLMWALLTPVLAWLLYEIGVWLVANADWIMLHIRELKDLV